MSAPAPWKISEISVMFSSKRPSVDGFVSINAAVCSSTFSRRSSMSMLPRGSVFTCVTSYPAIVTDAGFVPCAVSGITTVRRCSDSPRSSKYARTSAGRSATSRRSASRRHLGKDLDEQVDLRRRALLGHGHEQHVVHALVVAADRVPGMDATLPRRLHDVACVPSDANGTLLEC